jgi:hypothetical protein
MKERLSFAVLIFSLIWFGWQAWFMVTHIEFGVFPDEVANLALVKHALSGTPDNIKLGPIGLISPLYYDVAASLIWLFAPENDIFFLRLFSCLLGALCIILTFIYIRLLTGSPFSAAIGVVVLVNTLAFVYMSSAISWDIISNLFALLCIIFFVLRHRADDLTRYVTYVLLGLSALGVASLAKWTAWTFAPVLGIFLLIDGLRALAAQRSLKPPISPAQPREPQHPVAMWRYAGLGIALLAFAAAFIGNLSFYGKNVVNFGTINPADCVAVWGHAKCMAEDAAYNVRYSIHLQYENEPKLGFGPFVIEYTRILLIRLFSFVGHKEYVYNSRLMLIPFLYVFSVGFVLLLFQNWRRTKIDMQKGGPLLEAATLFIFYFVVLAIHNYKWYLWIGYLSAGVQGRYLLPVWPCLIALASLSLSRYEKDLPNIVAFGLIIPTVQVLLMTPSFSYFMDRLLGAS